MGGGIRATFFATSLFFDFFQDNQALEAGLSYAAGYYLKKMKISKHAKTCSGYESLAISKDNNNNLTEESVKFLLELDCGGLLHPTSDFMDFLRSINGFVSQNWKVTHDKKDILKLTNAYFENKSSINYFKDFPTSECCLEIFKDTYAYHKCKINIVKFNQNKSSEKQALRQALRPMGTRSRR